MSTFLLSLRLRVCYITLSLFSFGIYSSICSISRDPNQRIVAFPPSLFQFIDFCLNLALSVLTVGAHNNLKTPIIAGWLGNRGLLETVCILITGCLMVYLQTVSVDRMKDFYNQNLVGYKRAKNVTFTNRDVIKIDASWQAIWKMTKKYCFFRHFVSAFLFGLTFIFLVLFATKARASDIFPWLAVISAILGFLSIGYAEYHLCSEETTELHERPDILNNVATAAKREFIEHTAIAQADDILRSERKRNEPLNPPNENQRKLPRKPY